MSDDCISRQAAIKAIEKLCEECNADYCGECRVKFDGVKNCKTILEQLPPVKPKYCEDAISRQALKEKLKENHDFFVNAYGGFKNLPPKDKARVDEITICIAEVVNMPPVTPTEKVGRWILLDECSNSGYYCSECQKKVVKEGWSNTVKKIKYCPNCGAKMASQTSEEVEE